jgi:Mrp family chromosome partitioning ATPase
VVALLGPLAVWLVGRPSGVSAETFSASANITAPPDGDVNPIPQYAFIAADASDIASNVAEDLAASDPILGYAEADIQRIVSIKPLADISILTIAVKGQPSEIAARHVVERFAFHLVAHINNGRQAEIDESTTVLTSRETALRSQIATLNADLTAARSRFTPAQIDAGVTPDPAKDVELTVAKDSLGRVLAEIDALKEESDKAGTRLRASLSYVSADATESTPLGLKARLLLATALGLGFGAGLAFALHRFDTRIYNRREAEAAFGLPVLAEIPPVGWLQRRSWQLIARSRPEDPASEAYRLLRSSLAQAARSLPGRGGQGTDGAGENGVVLLVTSVSEHVGKTTTVANLAVAAVDSRKKVLVVSADLRRPTLQSFFGTIPGPGLTDAVDEMEDSGLAAVDLDSYLVPTAVLGATLFRSGHPVPHPGERLALAQPFIQQARTRFDLVIIDTPAMLLGNDVNELLPAVDLVLLVAKAGLTTREEADWSRETAQRLQAPLCGIALVGANSDLQRRGRLSGLFDPIARRIRPRSRVWGERVPPVEPKPAPAPAPNPEQEREQEQEPVSVHPAAPVEVVPVETAASESGARLFGPSDLVVSAPGPSHDMDVLAAMTIQVPAGMAHHGLATVQAASAPSPPLPPSNGPNGAETPRPSAMSEPGAISAPDFLASFGSPDADGQDQPAADLDAQHQSVGGPADVEN